MATLSGSVPGFLDFAAQWFAVHPSPASSSAAIVPGVPQVRAEIPTAAPHVPMSESLNLYAYANNNPLGLIDPLGLAPGDKWYGFNDPAFRDWVHQEKQKMGLPGNYQFSRAEVERLHCEWDDQGKPRGKGGKSGRGGQRRGGSGFVRGGPDD